MVYENQALTLSNLGGGRAGRNPPEWRTFLNNSKTLKGIQIKLFKFIFTPMGVIFHYLKIFIVVRVCHGNLLFPMSRGENESKRIRNPHIFHHFSLRTLKFGRGGYFEMPN